MKNISSVILKFNSKKYIDGLVDCCCVPSHSIRRGNYSTTMAHGKAVNDNKHEKINGNLITKAEGVWFKS